MLHGDNITVKADGCCLVVDDGTLDVTLGLALLLSIYWVYGFQYPRCLRRTFSFFDRYIFQLNSVTTVPIPVIKLFTELNGTT